MYKTIFHFEDDRKTEKLLNNVMNLLDDMEEVNEEISIEVLANADAVDVFKKENKDNQEVLKKLIQQGVTISVCQNSLMARDISENSLLEDIRIVRSGVGQLTRKQQDGWAYIKI